MASTGFSLLASMVCVAPKDFAYSSLAGLISMAMMGCACTRVPPCMTLRPIPPVPNTAMLAPGVTAAVLMTEPTPVMTEHPINAATSRGMSFLMGTAQEAGMTEYEGVAACRSVMVHGLSFYFHSGCAVPSIRPFARGGAFTQVR